jgi:hypothetical protein
MLLLSWLYAVHGQLPVIAALFDGLRAAVVAIVLEACRPDREAGAADAGGVRDRRRRHRWRSRLGRPFPWVVAGAALAGWSTARAVPVEARARGPRWRARCACCRSGSRRGCCRSRRLRSGAGPRTC